MVISCNDRPLSPLFYIVYIGKGRRMQLGKANANFCSDK